MTYWGPFLLLLDQQRCGVPGLTEKAEHAAASSAKEAVTGIGGFFFRAHDPEMLARWYQEHLGILVTPKSYHDPVWRQAAGITVFSPFPDQTDFFGDRTKQWLINFRVNDIQKLTQQLQAAGIAVKLDPKTYPNGRFARIHDPEGNPVELWEPKDPSH